MATANEGHVLMLLAALAEQTKEQLSDARLEFMARRLMDTAPPVRVCVALEKLLESARRFPTVTEIKEAMGLTEVSDTAKASEAAARIEGAMVKFGSARVGGNFDRQKDWMGPLAWAVVERAGGWQHLCDTTGNDDLPTLKAQWRNLAASLCESARAGMADSGPSLPEGPVHSAISELVDKFSMAQTPKALPKGSRL